MRGTLPGVSCFLRDSSCVSGNVGHGCFCWVTKSSATNQGLLGARDCCVAGS